MPTPADDVPDLLTGLATTRAIRRYRDEPIPEDDLASILWHATRAPSGSNRQPFRFLVLRDGPARDRGPGPARRELPPALGGQAARRWLRRGQRHRGRHAEGPHGGHHAALRRPLRVHARGRAGLHAPPSRARPDRGCLGLPGVPEPAARRPRPRLRRRAHDVAPARGGRAARACSASPTTSASPRRSPSVDPRVATGPCAAGRSRSSSTRTAGSSRRPGRRPARHPLHLGGPAPVGVPIAPTDHPGRSAPGEAGQRPSRRRRRRSAPSSKPGSTCSTTVPPATSRARTMLSTSSQVVARGSPRWVL